MTRPPRALFNPCSLDADEQLPAKIWELLRRNEGFRADVQRLIKLDARERDECKATKKYHGQDWHRSYRLVEQVSKLHPFAGVALQWLVPEPLFHCSIAVWPLGKKWRTRPAFVMRYSRIGVGTTPNVKDKNWHWRNPNQGNISGHSMVRGPEIRWTKSRFKRLHSWINPIVEWRKYPWPFTVDHSWPASPPGFQREFQFIWRNGFDCRPKNPLTKDRRDAPAPFETPFFRDWDLSCFQTTGQLSRDDLVQLIRFRNLADNFRVFAVPKTVLTKASAELMGNWLAEELKKGSSLYGDLIKGKLLNEAELLGTSNEWKGWLAHGAGQLKGVPKSTYFYRSRNYLDSLVQLAYPNFQIGKLLASPKHRARGKKYVRK